MDLEMKEAYTSIITRMADISPTARRHIDGQKWLGSVSNDDITDRRLANDLFSIIIEDFLTLGVEFHCSLDELCDSLYTMGITIKLAELVFPTALYRILKDNIDIAAVLYNVLNNGSPTGDSTIQCLVQYVGHEYSDRSSEKYLDMAVHLQDRITSTAIFDDYIKYMLTIDAVTIANIDDTDGHITAYLNDISTYRSQMIRLTDYIRNAIDTQNTWISAVYGRIEEYRALMTNPANIEAYAWAFTVDITAMNAMEIALRSKYINQFSETSPFSAKFYLVRESKVLTNVDVCTLIIGVFLIVEQSEFVATATKTLEMLAANNITISPENVSLWNTIRQLLVDRGKI